MAEDCLCVHSPLKDPLVWIARKTNNQELDRIKPIPRLRELTFERISIVRLFQVFGPRSTSASQLAYSGLANFRSRC